MKKAGGCRTHLYRSATLRFTPDQNLNFALKGIGKLWSGDITTHQITMQA
jgi:hypothetical protein